MWETYVIGVYFLFFFPNLPLHILNAFSHSQSSMSRIIFISTNSTSGTFVYNYLHLPERRAALVLQHNLGVGVLTLLGNYIPRCKAKDSKRYLTWEQYTLGNRSQDSILYLFLRTCKVLHGSLPLSLALCCHLNRLTVHKSMWKVGRVTIREEMLPF